VSSSGHDEDGVWLQVVAGALKHCVASGCIPKATLLLKAIRGRKRAPLASGQITGADTAQPLLEVASTAMRLLADASTTLAPIRASKHL
jgi:hypothetical protein